MAFTTTGCATKSEYQKKIDKSCEAYTIGAVGEPTNDLFPYKPLTIEAMENEKFDGFSAIFIFPSSTEKIISDSHLRRALRNCTLPIVMVDSKDLVIGQFISVRNSKYGDYGKENGDIQYSYNVDYEDGTGVSYYNTTLKSCDNGYALLTDYLIAFHNYETAEEIEKAITPQE